MVVQVPQGSQRSFEALYCVETFGIAFGDLELNKKPAKDGNKEKKTAPLEKQDPKHQDPKC